MTVAGRVGTRGAIAALLVVALVIGSLLWRRGEPEAVRWRGETMGTTYAVTWVVPRSGDAWAAPRREALRGEVDARLQEVNRAMSTFLEDSELSRFNRAEAGRPFPLSADTLAVFRVALEVSEASGGAFDVTVGPLVDAWGFGPEGDPARLPEEAQIAALRERVGFHHLRLDPAASTIVKDRADVRCDLSAVAKGYGVDAAAELLEARGVGDYLVEVGGEVRARGRSARGRPWRIGIEEPAEDRRQVRSAIELEEGAIATSGDYRNFRVREGRRFSHTIDPRTGRPVEPRLASVSVYDERCAVADAWATALMVLGPEEGYHLAERIGLSALLLEREPGGGFLERRTGWFRARAER